MWREKGNMFLQIFLHAQAQYPGNQNKELNFNLNGAFRNFQIETKTFTSCT